MLVAAALAARAAGSSAAVAHMGWHRVRLVRTSHRPRRQRPANGAIAHRRVAKWILRDLRSRLEPIDVCTVQTYKRTAGVTRPYPPQSLSDSRGFSLSLNRLVSVETLDLSVFPDCGFRLSGLRAGQGKPASEHLTPDVVSPRARPAGSVQARLSGSAAATTTSTSRTS